MIAFSSDSLYGLGDSTVEGISIPRKSTVIELSVSAALAKEYNRLSVRQGMTKSELFKRMIETYKIRIDEEEFFRLQRKMSKRARDMGVFPEKEQA
mgnify:CR=1 FL=1